MATILDFRIRPQSGNTYLLEVFERNRPELLASATFDYELDYLTGFRLDTLEADGKDHYARFERLQAFGQALYRKIFTGEVQKVWRSYKESGSFLILCLRIHPDAAGLEALPWETLFDGESFLAADVNGAVTRLPLDIDIPAALPPIPRPLRMLAFVSSPLDLPDLSRLRIEDEQEILLRAINDPAGEGRLSADFEDEGKLEILENSLEAGYHILHFTGHGIGPEQGGGLLLEGVQGKMLPVAVDDIVKSIGKGQKTLRLAVISGCQTARTLHAGTFRDLGRELLRNRIPAVIAMQFSITDDAGLKFAEVFYPRLASGRTLEESLHAARRALLNSEHYHLKADAFAPVLLTCDGNCLTTTEARIEAAAEPKIDFSFYLPLPQLKFGFYGRRREFRLIRDGLLHKNHRAVIVHGIGGIGKTALISHIADRLRKHFHGVYGFDCRGGNIAPETVLLELHRYLSMRGMNQLQPLIGQSVPPEMLANFLAQLLSQLPLLLIFDNFESLLDENHQIADGDMFKFLNTLVKTTATGSKFLFTTRYLFDLDQK